MNHRNCGIPKEVALGLCADIRRKYRGKWWTLAGMQCMGCNAATKGDDHKRCVSNATGYRGCNLVNSRYDCQTDQGSSTKAGRTS